MDTNPARKQVEVEPPALLPYFIDHKLGPIELDRCGLVGKQSQVDADVASHRPCLDIRPDGGHVAKNVKETTVRLSCGERPGRQQHQEGNCARSLLRIHRGGKQLRSSRGH
jgi:hypothetical protein